MAASTGQAPPAMSLYSTKQSIAAAPLLKQPGAPLVGGSNLGAVY